MYMSQIVLNTINKKFGNDVGRLIYDYWIDYKIDDIRKRKINSELKPLKYELYSKLQYLEKYSLMNNKLHICENLSIQVDIVNMSINISNRYEFNTILRFYKINRTLYKYIIYEYDTCIKLSISCKLDCITYDSFNKSKHSFFNTNGTYINYDRDGKFLINSSVLSKIINFGNEKKIFDNILDEYYIFIKYLSLKIDI